MSLEWPGDYMNIEKFIDEDVTWKIDKRFYYFFGFLSRVYWYSFDRPVLLPRKKSRGDIWTSRLTRRCGVTTMVIN